MAVTTLERVRSAVGNVNDQEARRFRRHSVVYCSRWLPTVLSIQHFVGDRLCFVREEHVSLGKPGFN